MKNTFLILLLIITLNGTLHFSFAENVLKNISSFDWILNLRDGEKIKSKAQLIDIDVLDNDKNTVQQLKKEGKIVIGYINVGSIENYREDYKDFPKSVVGKVYPDWEDERFLDIRNYKKFKHLIINRLDIAQQKGFDGIEPDNMDIYDNFEETGFKISQKDMSTYLVWLQKEVHKRGMFLIQKNAPDLSKNMQPYFDGALLEGAFHNTFSQDFVNYISVGKTVLNTEYTDNTTKKYFLENICPRSKKLGFISILKHRNLDSFVVNCPTIKPSPQLREIEKNNTLHIKINRILQRFYTKLDRKYSHHSTKIQILNRLNAKITLLKNKKSHNKKLVSILNILEKNIGERIFWYNYQIFEDGLESKNNLKDFGKNKKLIAKKDKIYFGAFQEFGGGETTVTQQKLQTFQKLLGRKPAWTYFSQDFAEEGIVFPMQSVEKIMISGEIPFIRLMPSMVYETNKKNYNLQDIASGKFNTQLIQWAQKAKSINHPLFIDFAVEMNGNWFFYSGKPELYKKAYRHIIDIFRKQGVKNVTWFFHPDINSFPDKKGNKPVDYYPGDDYIDWIGFSLYGTQNPVDENIDFNEALKEKYQDILDISHNKPFALLEFGVADFNPNYKKEVWLKNTFETIIKNPYIQFSAISIWSEKWEDKNYYSDLRIQSSKKSLEVYKKYLHKNIFSNKLEYKN